MRAAAAETATGWPLWAFLRGDKHPTDAVRQSDTRGSGVQDRLRPRHGRALPAEGPAGTQGVNDDSALSFKGLTRDRVNTVGAGGMCVCAARAT